MVHAVLAQAALQLVILSLIDPTGLLAFCMSVVVGYSSVLGVRSFSRHCEDEADTMGLRVVKQACFDPERAAHMMGKFAELEHAPAIFGSEWERTHPFPVDRLERLLSQSTAIKDKGLDDEDHCEDTGMSLRKAIAVLTGAARAPAAGVPKRGPPAADDGVISGRGEVVDVELGSTQPDADAEAPVDAGGNARDGPRDGAPPSR